MDIGEVFLKYKARFIMKKIIFAAAVILSAAVFASCASSDVKSSAAGAINDVPLSESRSEKPAQKKLFKGEGLVIAVLPPGFSGASQSEQWMPQYFQDSITGKIASFSKMTVLDRKNESLAVAEQERSESGFYSEENAVEIGKMTNANLVAAGSVQKIADSYELNFRVNDTETNEVKAAFNSRYSLSQMQDGTAVNETAAALLEGLGIELSDSERAALEKTNKLQNSSAMNLAKGSAAEKNGNLFDALLAYTQVDGTLKTEADSSISKILNGSISGLSVTEKVRRYETEIAKWTDLFQKWRDYLNSGNWFFCVYDFSEMKDTVEFSSGKSFVDFIVTPGVKIVPKREAVLLHKQIFDSWKAVASQPENKEWVRGVPAKDMQEFYYTVSVNVDLMNEYGISMKRYFTSFSFDFCDFFSYHDWAFQGKPQVLTQRNYYNVVNFGKLYFTHIDAQDITDTITPVISEIKLKGNGGRGTKMKTVSVPVLSVSEAADFFEQPFSL